MFCHPPNSPAGAECSACFLNAAFDAASSGSFGKMLFRNHTHEFSACRNHLDDVYYVAVDRAWTRILCCSLGKNAFFVSPSFDGVVGVAVVPP